MFCVPIYPIEAGAGPIRVWRDFLADKHDRVGSIVEFSTIPSPRTTRRPRGAGASSRWPRSTRAMPPRASRCSSRSGSWREPVADFSGQMGYVEVQRLFDAITPFGRIAATGRAGTWTDWATT